MTVYSEVVNGKRVWRDPHNGASRTKLRLALEEIGIFHKVKEDVYTLGDVRVEIYATSWSVQAYSFRRTYYLGSGAEFWISIREAWAWREIVSK